MELRNLRHPDEIRLEGRRPRMQMRMKGLLSFPVIIILEAVFSMCAMAQSQAGPNTQFRETEVSFITEDRWTIYGTLSMPASLKSGEKVPGVVLVHSPLHDRDIYLGRHLVALDTQAKDTLRGALGSTATLRIDIRGRGKSSTPKEYSSFTEEQRGRVALDVAAALDFLSRNEHIDSGRMGVVAEGASAEAAVVAVSRDDRVRGLVLLSGRVGQAAKDQVRTREDLPVLCVASKEDKTAVVDMAGVFVASRSPESDLMMLKDVGAGNSMFIMFANKFPKEKSLESVIGDWLTARLDAAPQLLEVSFQSSDGWKLYGHLRIPRNPGDKRVPGIIFVHSYLTDRHIFDHTEEMLSAAGFAVLNFDFRGRGKSIAKGTYFDLPPEERDKAYLDVRAAADFLASQKGVDPNRLAMVTSSIGVKYGLKAASTDARVRSFVMLGGMPDRTDVEKASFPILFVSSLGLPPIAQAFRDFYAMKKALGSQLLEFEGGAVGYQLFEMDQSIQPLIVRWLKPQLTIP